MVGLDCYQLRTTAREVEHLQCTRMFDQMIKVLGDQRFGADNVIHRNRILGKQARTLQILGRTNSRNLGRGMKYGRSHLAGNHIDLVAVGQRDNHIGIISAGLFEQTWVGAITANSAQIESLLQFRQNLLIDIDDSQLVAIFLRQLCGHSRADLART